MERNAADGRELLPHRRSFASLPAMLFLLRLNILCSYQDKCAAISFRVLPLISAPIPPEKTHFFCVNQHWTNLPRGRGVGVYILLSSRLSLFLQRLKKRIQKKRLFHWLSWLPRTQLFTWLLNNLRRLRLWCKEGCQNICEKNPVVQRATRGGVLQKTRQAEKEKKNSAHLIVKNIVCCFLLFDPASIPSFVWFVYVLWT